jgi:hypothetical protein
MPRQTNATTSLSNWDFNNHHVQAELISGEFISAESFLIAAGPPELSMITSNGSLTQNPDYVFPIGAMQQFTVGQSQALAPIFEIGSTRAYFMTGKNVGSIQCGRILYSGVSLLKAMYAYYRQSNPALALRFMNKPKGSTLMQSGGYYLDDPEAALLELEIQKGLIAITDRPGYADFWINLASDLFKQPTGLMMYLKNQNGRPYGAGYIENCHVGSHNISLQAGSNMLVEGASMSFDRIVPVDVQASSWTPITMANV